MKWILILVTGYWIVSCTTNLETTSPEPTTTPTKLPEELELKVPADVESGKKMMVWGTWYFVPRFESASSGITLLDLNNKSLGVKLSEKDFCTAALEGTAIIGDKTYNYAGTTSKRKANCSKYVNHDASSFVVFYVTSHAYGVGSKSNPLVPFKSIAAKHNVFPYGTRVHIPKAKGVVYTFEGKQYVHDGNFVVNDTGGMLKQNQFDFFIGTSKVNPFKFVTSNSKDLFEVIILK